MASLNTSEVTEHLEEDYGVGIIIYIAFMGVALLFAVISNGLVIYCVARFKKLRTVTNIFICNLSVSDILLAGFVMPQRLHDISHHDDFYEGEILCKVVNFFPILVISSSIYTLVTVSFERRQVILDTQTQGHKQRLTKRKIMAVLAFIWVFATGVSVPTFMEYTVLQTETIFGNTTKVILSCGSQFSRELAIGNAIFVLVVSYFIPMILLTKNYSQLAFYMWNKLKKIKQNMQNLANLRLFMQRMKVIKLLVLVAIVFVVSWLPYFGVLLYAKVTGKDTSENAAGFVNLLLLALATFSTAYNVVLYVLFNPSFKQAILSVLKCARTSYINDRVRVEQSQQTPVSPLEQSGVVSVVADRSSQIAVITARQDFTSLENEPAHDKTYN